MLRQLLLVASSVLCAAALAQAQWVTIKLPNTPRAKDGTPNLNAPAPACATAKWTSPASGTRIPLAPTLSDRPKGKRSAKIER